MNYYRALMLCCVAAVGLSISGADDESRQDCGNVLETCESAERNSEGNRNGECGDANSQKNALGSQTDPLGDVQRVFAGSLSQRGFYDEYVLPGR